MGGLSWGRGEGLGVRGMGGLKSEGAYHWNKKELTSDMHYGGN